MIDKDRVDPNTDIVVGNTEISLRRGWLAVPSARINDQTLVVTGKRIRMAGLQNEDWVQEELNDPVGCVHSLKSLPHSIADILVYSQKVPDVTPHFQYPMELRSIAVANVFPFEPWWESLPQETRKNVRRSRKRGVSIEVRSLDDGVVQGIADVQNETPIRQGRAYIHYGKSLDRVRRDHGEFLDHSDFICAYFEGEFIGFLKLVYRGEVASLLQLNSKSAHSDKRPSNALLAKAAELCAAKGIRYLTYGKFRYGRKGDNPLREFKVRHGFAEMLVPIYYVPLTAWGRICVAGKFYRGLLDILPESVISTTVNLRNRWYNRDSLKPV